MKKILHGLLSLLILIARGVVALMVCLTLFVIGCYWGSILLRSLSVPYSYYLTIATLLSASISALMAVYVWKWSGPLSNGERFGIVRYVVMAATILGGFSFIAGLIIPYVIDPHGQQGFFAAFLAGPLGLVIGAIGGLIYGIRKNLPR